jgi:ABC-type hemin transport system substrate-binding protein
VLVSTVPLSDEGWVPLAPDRLLVINRGEIQLYADPLI